MTKPLPTGCIEKEEVPSRRKLDLLLETLNLDDKIGHLFVVDIHFGHKIQPLDNFYTTKHSHQLLRNIKLLMQLKDLSTIISRAS